MAVKYLMNSNIHGYEKASIEDFEINNQRDNTIIAVIDKSCDNKLGKYYTKFTQALKNNNRLVLVGVNDSNKSFKPLASLMVTYNNYGIYQIEDKNALGALELQKMVERQPDYTEVQTFVGGDITAYSDMSTIIFGIESLVNEGNDEQLKTFLDQHMLSIESLTSTLNSMKKTCDLFNSDELVEKINEMKSKEESLKKQIEDKDKTMDSVKYDRDKFKVEAETLKRENEKLKATNTELQDSSQGSSVIKSYKELNTQLINCKTKSILYFKEISYVPYVNSLVMRLMEVIELHKLKVKMVIFDSSTNLYLTYKPLQTVSGNDYLTMKGTLLSKTKQFVVSEPNTTILQDILTSDQCFDVVIVYDRLKCANDIVVGNNVSKFYVMNSSKEFNSIKQQLKIQDLSYIITHAHSTIGIDKNSKDKDDNREFLDIPFIEGYTQKTDAAKTSMYMRLHTAFSDLPLIETIFKKSRIDKLMPTKQ